MERTLFSTFEYDGVRMGDVKEVEASQYTLRVDPHTVIGGPYLESILGTLDPISVAKDIEIWSKRKKDLYELGSYEGVPSLMYALLSMEFSRDYPETVEYVRKNPDVMGKISRFVGVVRWLEAGAPQD